MLRHLILLCIVWVSVVNGRRYGNCWRYGQLKNVYTEYGNVEYCETKEIHPEYVLLGDDITTKDCYHCTCTTTGLYCCGIGAHAYPQGVEPPEGCQLLIRGCNYTLVRMEDINTPCYTGGDLYL